MAARSGDSEATPHGVLLSSRGKATFRRSLAWASFGSLGRQAVQFIGLIILARVLTPADYGLAAIVVAINAFAFIFTDLGIGAAVVRQSRLTASYLATAFYMNVASGVFLTLLISGLAYPLASFFDRPELVFLVQVASLSFTLSFSVVPLAILHRRMRFRVASTTELATTVVGTAVSVVAAYSGLGATSLVLGPLTTTILTSAATFALAPVPLGSRPTKADAAEIYRFGWALAAFNSINYWSRNADNLLVGTLGATALGYYSRAYQLMMLPVQQISGVLQRVLLPVLSGLQDDRARLAKRWIEVAHLSWIVGLPFSVLTAVAADSIILVLLGDQWRGAIDILAILALSVAPQLPMRTIGAAFQATGRTKLQLGVGSLNAVILLSLMFIGLNWGATGVAVGVTIGMYIVFLVGGTAVGHATGASLAALCRYMLPGVFAAAFMAACTLGVRALTAESEAYLSLLVQGIAGMTSYCVSIVILDRRARAHVWSTGPGRRLQRARTSATPPMPVEVKQD